MINIDGVGFNYDDATQDVVLQRKLIHVWMGQPGVAAKCMNAACIMDNEGAFPHPVLACSVIKTKVYIIDSWSPRHAVRYSLSDRDSALIAAHDEQKIAEPGELRLLAPRGHDRQGERHHDDELRTHAPAKDPGSKVRRIGDKARLLAAVGIAGERTMVKEDA